MPPRYVLRFLLLLAALIVVTAPAGAEELTLAEVLRRARASAPEVAAARARAAASAARLDEARGHRLPSLTLAEIWTRTDSPAEAFALQLNQERFSFPDFAASDPNDPQTIVSATTRLEASLPVFTGGELASRVEQAALAADAASDRVVSAADAAALAAAEAYIGLAQAREQAALMQRSLAAVSGHADLARAYTEQGMLVRSELLRSEVERARVQDLLTAAEGRARVASANLSYRLAAQPTGDWQLAPLPKPEPITEPLDAFVATSKSRPDLQAARRLLAAGELEIAARRSARMPRIGIVARYDLVDDSLFGDHGESAALMAVGSVDLWSGGRHRAATDAAAAEYEAGQRELERFADAVALEVTDAFERAVTAVARHQTAAAALDAAAEAARITRERFTQGVVKMIDVLDATTAHREAEMRELVGRAEAHLESFRLAVAAGRRPEDAQPPTSASPSPSPALNSKESRP